MRKFRKVYILNFIQIFSMSKKEGETVSAKDKYISKKLLLESTIRKIDYYSSKNSLTDIELYYVVKDFFTEFLELKYEFSLDELLLELDKIYLESDQREVINSFINKIKIIEFEDSTFSQEKVKDLMREFSLIARKIAKLNEPEKKGFMKKITSFFVKKENPNSNLKTEVTSEIRNSTESLDLVTSEEFSKTENNINDDEISMPEFEEKYVPNLDKSKIIKTVPASTDELVNDSKNTELKNKSSGNYVNYKKNYKQSPDAKTEKYVAGDDWILDTKLVNKTYQEQNTKSKTSTKDVKPKDSTPKSSAKDEFNQLLDKAKNSSKKSELTQIYKKINEMYDSADVDFQARYYKDLMDIYQKLSKLK